MKKKKKKPIFKRTKNPQEGICVIIEDKKKCSKSTHARGLCNGHHRKYLRDVLPEKYVNKVFYAYVKDVKYSINKNHKKGFCRIIQNSVTCEEKIHCRGVCRYHQQKLHRAGLLAKYGTKLVNVREDVANYTINETPKKNKCRIINNDESCENNAIHRGLCHPHRSRVHRCGVYEEFVLTLMIKLKQFLPHAARESN